MRVRELSPEEWQPFRDLRLRSLTTDPDAFGGSLEVEAARPDEFWRDRLSLSATKTKSWALFAEDGELQGMIGGYRKDDQLVELTSMYVAPEHRGKGIGKRLIEALEQEFLGAGFKRIFLYVDERQGPAIKLYEACGFTEEPSTWEGKRRFEKSLS